MTGAAERCGAPSSAVRRRLVALAGSLAVGLVLAALVVVGGAPTGVPDPEGVVPGGSRVAARADTDGAVVLVVAEGTDRYVMVARRGAKGWFGLRAPDPEAGAPVAWTATTGGSGVPALSAAYGRAPGAARAVVTWADGRRQVGRVGLDGTWLVARRGRVGLREARVVDGGGRVVERVAVR